MFFELRAFACGEFRKFRFEEATRIFSLTSARFSKPAVSTAYARQRPYAQVVEEVSPSRPWMPHQLLACQLAGCMQLRQQTLLHSTGSGRDWVCVGGDKIS